MPGISSSKIAIPFNSGGVDESSYWTTRTPTALILTVLSDTSIKLDWTNGADEDYDGLRVYSSTDGVNFTELDNVGGTDETYTATSLTAGTLYYFNVVAYKGSNESTATDTESGLTGQDFDKIYYWWYNAVSGNTRQIELVGRIAGTTNGIQYTVKKSFDDFYEVVNTKKCSLELRSQGEITIDNGLLDSTNVGGNIEDQRKFNKISFAGTDLYARVLKSTNRGIFRAIIGIGTSRGWLKCQAYNMGRVNADKAEGRYYLILQAGNYTTIDASMASLVVGDIIYYHNSAWQILHEADYTYIDIDTYAAVEAYSEVTLYTGLAYGTYNVAIIALDTKNPSSSGTTCYLQQGSRMGIYSFRVLGSQTVNYSNATTELNDLGHFSMSMRIEKNGYAGDSEWIPDHVGSQALTYGGVYDMQNWLNGVEKTGYNTGDQGLVELTSKYRLLSTAYGTHFVNAAEHLMLVTTEMVFDIGGWTIKNTYKAIIATHVDTTYSYMLPYRQAVYNRIVTDYKEEKTIPATANTVNITDGGNRKMVLAYNNTDGGANEGYFTKIIVPFPDTTNDDKTQQSFIYTIDGSVGKLYLKSQADKVYAIDEEYKTEIKFVVGYRADLINEIIAYLV